MNTDSQWSKHVPLGCGHILLPNYFNVCSVLHRQVSLAAVNQIYVFNEAINWSFSELFFFISQKNQNGKTNKVNQQSVLIFKYFTVSLSKIHRQDLKNILKQKKKHPIFMVLYLSIQLRCRNKNKTNMFIKRQTHKNW